MTSIHPTAIIEKGAQIAPDAAIGPYCVIGPEVVVGAASRLVSHIAVSGRTRIGDRCTVYPFASLGHPPQDLKFKGEKSELVIGNDNTIREQVTMNPGTEGGGMITSVGDRCLFMVGAHVAHDCRIGSGVILANNATLGGHVEVGDHAIIGGLAAVHQFVRIGRHAIIGGMSGVENDVIPYGSVMGERAGLAGLNLVGLKRRGFDRDAIHALRNAYKQLFEGPEGTFAERTTQVKDEFGKNAEVMEILLFIQQRRDRSLCMPRGVLDPQPQAA
jgi:UDP-N-acetylglucosamine acyltransferase